MIEKQKKLYKIIARQGLLSKLLKNKTENASVQYATSIDAAYKYTDAGHTMYAEILDAIAENFKVFLKNVL